MTYPGTPVDAEAFLGHCTGTFPNATLSLGWTTGATGSYSLEDHLNPMHEMLDKHMITGPVTLPLRASLTTPSVPAISDFLLKVTFQS